MKRKGFRIKYPKFLLLILIFILTFFLAYILFHHREFLLINNFLLSLGPLGAFIAGIFFPYGFTAAPATAVLLIIAKDQNILVSGFLAGFGALLSDLLIFRFIRSSFKDELKLLSKEKIFLKIGNYFPQKINNFLIDFVAAIFIASPLPNEIGVSLMATSRTISTKIFSIFCYILNTAGIFIILLIGNSL